MGDEHTNGVVSAAAGDGLTDNTDAVQAMIDDLTAESTLVDEEATRRLSRRIDGSPHPFVERIGPPDSGGKGFRKLYKDKAARDTAHPELALAERAVAVAKDAVEALMEAKSVEPPTDLTPWVLDEATTNEIRNQAREVNRLALEAKEAQARAEAANQRLVTFMEDAGLNPDLHAVHTRPPVVHASGIRIARGTVYARQSGNVVNKDLVELTMEQLMPPKNRAERRAAEKQ